MAVPGIVSGRLFDGRIVGGCGGGYLYDLHDRGWYFGRKYQPIIVRHEQWRFGRDDWQETSIKCQCLERPTNNRPIKFIQFGIWISSFCRCQDWNGGRIEYVGDKGGKERRSNERIWRGVAKAHAKPNISGSGFNPVPMVGLTCLYDHFSCEVLSFNSQDSMDVTDRAYSPTLQQDNQP